MTPREIQADQPVAGNCAYNLVSIAGLAAFVLVEKLAPFSPLIGRAIGFLLIATGRFLLMPSAISD